MSSEPLQHLIIAFQCSPPLSLTLLEKRGKEEEITIMKCNYKLLRGPNTHVVHYIGQNFLQPRWVAAHTYCTKERLCQSVSTRLWHRFAISVALKNWCTWIAAKSNSAFKRRIQKIISLLLCSLRFHLSSSLQLSNTTWVGVPVFSHLNTKLRGWLVCYLAMACLQRARWRDRNL